MEVLWAALVALLVVDLLSVHIYITLLPNSVQVFSLRMHTKQIESYNIHDRFTAKKKCKQSIHLTQINEVITNSDHINWTEYSFDSAYHEDWTEYSIA